MRLIEGKKDPRLQKLILEKEKQITNLLDQYSEIYDKITILIRDWSTLIEAERELHGEEWMITDQMRIEKFNYMLLPKWLRKE